MITTAFDIWFEVANLGNKDVARSVWQAALNSDKDFEDWFNACTDEVWKNRPREYVESWRKFTRICWNAAKECGQ